MTFLDRFWDKVDKTRSGCWLWTGCTNADGYGRLALGRKRTEKAHRVSWELHNGPIPDGAEVCHTCDNPGCVNPDHLFLGTHQDNMTDMRRKGRAVGHRGSSNPRATITELDVVRLRREWAKGVATGRKRGLLKRMSRAHSVPYGTLRKIIHRQTWQHVQEG